jgi:hypothetical protein
MAKVIEKNLYKLKCGNYANILAFFMPFNDFDLIYNVYHYVFIKSLHSTAGALKMLLSGRNFSNILIFKKC